MSSTVSTHSSPSTSREALSTAAIGLQRLAALGSADDPETARYSSSARTMMAILGHVAGETPLAFANLLLAIELDAVGITEVVIVGDRPDLVAEARATWRPLTVLAWGETGNGSLWEARENGLAYVCEGQVCHQPVGTKMKSPGMHQSCSRGCSCGSVPSRWNW